MNRTRMSFAVMAAAILGLAGVATAHAIADDGTVNCDPATIEHGERSAIVRLVCAIPTVTSTQTVTVTATETVTVTVTTGSTTTGTTTTAPPPAPGYVVDAPQPPSAYAVPAGATAVSTSAALVANLTDGVAEDIVLETGTYASSSYFTLNQGDRLYARSLGGALLTSGISVGGGAGSLIKGLVVSVSSASLTTNGAAVNYWGGSGHRIMDTAVDGNRALEFGVRSKRVEGFVAQRLVIRNTTGWGLYVDTYPDRSYLPSVKPTFTDLNVANVSRATPRSSNGTAEACVWIGVASNPVERLLLRECAWEALWTGVSVRMAPTVFRDIDIADSTRQAVAGIYTEHYSWGATFEQFRIVGPTVGINNEWDSGGPGTGACQGCTYQDGYIDSVRVGIGFEPGTLDSTARRIKLVGQCWAGINDWDDSGDWRLQGNVYDEVDFSGIDPGAVAVRHEWSGGATCR